MRRGFLIAAVALAGCGNHRHQPLPRPAPIAEHAHPPWSKPLPGAPAPRTARVPKQRGWDVSASDAVAGAAAVVEEDENRQVRVRVVVGARTTILATADGSVTDYPPLQDVAISRDTRGRVLVVWADDRNVHAWENGGGPALTVGRDYVVTTVAAGLADGGRAVVAWGTHDLGEELNRANQIFTAVRDPGAPAFAPAAEVDRGDALSYHLPRLELAVTPRSAVLVWNLHNRGRRQPVRAARSGERGGFGEAVTLGNGTPGPVALRGDGAALVSWTQAYRAYAALASPGRLPARPEIVSDADRAFSLEAGFGADGRARLAWTTHRPPQVRYSAVRTR